MKNDNEECASNVGQEKQYKDVTHSYDAYCGSYKPLEKPEGDLEGAPKTVEPFAGLRKGK